MWQYIFTPEALVMNVIAFVMNSHCRCVFIYFLLPDSIQQSVVTQINEHMGEYVILYLM